MAQPGQRRADTRPAAVCGARNAPRAHRLLAPVAVTLGMGGGLVWKAVTSGEPADASLAAGMWFFIVCAWSGCLWLTRGTWHPRSETTAAYIELSIARCESWVRATPFAMALYLGNWVSCCNGRCATPSARYPRC